MPDWPSFREMNLEVPRGRSMKLMDKMPPKPLADISHGFFHLCSNAEGNSPSGRKDKVNCKNCYCLWFLLRAMLAEKIPSAWIHRLGHQGGVLHLQFGRDDVTSIILPRWCQGCAKSACMKKEGSCYVQGRCV